MIIRNITIENFQSYYESQTIEFSKGLNLIIGNGGKGKSKLFIGSPDWMRRNLYRRIEAVTPVLDPALKQELIDMLTIQLADRRKACFVDGQLRNVWKSSNPQKEIHRAQYDFYTYLKKKQEDISGSTSLS